MPIDIHQERLVTLCEAAKLLPKLNNKRVSANAIWRWCRKGVSGAHLEHVRIGGRICTSAEGLNRFANALAEADIERLNPPAPETTVRRRCSAKREAEIRAAEEYLRSQGI